MSINDLTKLIIYRNQLHKLNSKTDEYNFSICKIAEKLYQIIMIANIVEIIDKITEVHSPRNTQLSCLIIKSIVYI